MTPPRITLAAVSGDLAGKEFQFEDRTTCIVGRARDCQIKIPSSKTHTSVSRHHCMLDINSPDVRIRDFGSLNGTRVNSELIGKRDKDQTPEQGQAIAFPERDLQDGDTIHVGNAAFRVSVYVPAVCEDCGEDIPEQDRENAQTGRDVYVCYRCRARSLMTQSIVTNQRKAATCLKCGRDVSDEANRNRRGDYICSSCRADPFKILKRLLGLAKTGKKELATIEGYELVKELGRGGMGAVYLARHAKSGELAALKVMLPQAAASPRAREMFLREVENTKSLRHDNVVRFRDAGYSDGAFFFTMEYCNAGGMDKLLTERGTPLGADEAVSIILQCLDGLDYAHNARVPHVKLMDGTIGQGKGLVHRDISPQNILLSQHNSSLSVKITDFGLSKAFDLAGFSGLTCSGAAAGKPLFICRQQLIDYKYAKPEVDVWAAAATLYAGLTGFAPRDFVRGRDVWRTVLEDDPVPIRQRGSRLPAALANVIDQALDDRGDLCFQNAAQLRRAIEDAL